MQRAVTDLAADLPFAQAMDKLVEHYGVLLHESTIRRVTEGHAQRMFATTPPQTSWPPAPGCAVVVAEMDGGMVPIVAPDSAQADRRKGKHLQWKEAKICLAHASGSRALSYGGTLQGDACAAGQQLFDCALRSGFGQGTRLHAVGDGAEWIAAQVEKQFGTQGRYLVDFYHVCEYLAAAGAAIAPDPEGVPRWLDTQKTQLKQGQAEVVLATLQAHLEPAEVPEAQAPVRRCHRYLSQRRDQLDYPGALANDLPIGSGEIESAHRHVVQQRLKRPGAWWRLEHAEHMLALRLKRANGQWTSYWADTPRLAA